MDKPDQKSATFPELQAANVEYTAEQYRALYYELVEKAVLPRDFVTLFQNPRVRSHGFASNQSPLCNSLHAGRGVMGGVLEVGETLMSRSSVTHPFLGR